MQIKKGKLHFGQRDLLCMDQHFSDIIYQGLTQMRASKRYGIPMVLYDQVDETTEGIVEKLWDDMLDQMIYAFSPVQDYSHIEADIYRYEYQFEDNHSDQSSFHMKRIMLNNHHEDEVAAFKARRLAWELEDQQKRLRGRQLFAEYFGYLHTS